MIKASPAVLLFMALLALTACQPAPVPTAQPTQTMQPTPTVEPAASIPTTAIVNGVLIDGTGAAAIPNGVVLIQGDKITAAGPRAQVSIPANATLIDVQGAAILPGFINAHVHDGFNPANLKAWAQGGVTTVRDESVGSRGAVDTQLEARRTTLNKPEYARIISAGAMITAPGGYGHLFITDTAEDARKAALDELNAGVDLLKVAREDGYAGTTGLPKLGDAAIQAIAQAAHERGTKVSAHITQARYLTELIPLGVDDMAHTPYDYLSDEAIQQMVAKKISMNTTISVLKSYGAPLNQPVNNLRRFVKAGGVVVLGNDYAGGRSLADFELGIPMFEITKMAEAGMTPMQIIQAATYNAADACNKLAEIGTLAPGKFADVLVVRGDPLSNIQALTNVQMVIHQGVIIVNND